MEQTDFNTIVQTTISIIKGTLTNKEKEYARGDRLHNFKVAAALDGTTPETALKGMMTKHVVSVYDMVHDIENGKDNDLSLWDEKIIDNINYLILLRALVYERHQYETLEI